MTPYFDNGIVQLYQADAREIPLPDQSAHCVVTSPPYWGLRDYGLGPDTLGLEQTPELYVQRIVDIFREVRRVLRDDGTLWLNLGDSYANDRKWGGKSGRKNSSSDADGYPRHKMATGLKEKDLVGIPWMVAFALREDGWWLRSDIIWSKSNPMPESVTDRPTRAHEYLFLLTKSARYFYDADAIKEPAKESSIARWDQHIVGQQGSFRANGGEKTNGPMKAVGGPKKNKQRGHRRRHEGFNDRWDNMTKDKQQALGANKRSVWEIATQPFGKMTCPSCNRSFKAKVYKFFPRCNGHPICPRCEVLLGSHFATFPEALVEPCILAGAPTDGLVLDPFAGTATVCAVAQRLGRHAVGVDLKKEYLELAVQRLSAVPLPLLETFDA